MKLKNAKVANSAPWFNGYHELRHMQDRRKGREGESRYFVVFIPHRGTPSQRELTEAEAFAINDRMPELERAFNQLWDRRHKREDRAALEAERAEAEGRRREIEGIQLELFEEVA